MLIYFEIVKKGCIVEITTDNLNILRTVVRLVKASKDLVLLSRGVLRFELYSGELANREYVTACGRDVVIY